ncbi:hypothetical protein CC79DRAFT_1378146 [Sarocladium strictum]
MIAELLRLILLLLLSRHDQLAVATSLSCCGEKQEGLYSKDKYKAQRSAHMPLHSCHSHSTIVEKNPSRTTFSASEVLDDMSLPGDSNTKDGAKPHDFSIKTPPTETADEKEPTATRRTSYERGSAQQGGVQPPQAAGKRQKDPDETNYRLQTQSPATKSDHYVCDWHFERSRAWRPRYRMSHGFSLEALKHEQHVLMLQSMQPDPGYTENHHRPGSPCG